MRKVAALSAFFAVTAPGYSWAASDKNENGFIASRRELVVCMVIVLEYVY